MPRLPNILISPSNKGLNESSEEVHSEIFFFDLWLWLGLLGSLLGLFLLLLLLGGGGSGTR